MLKIYAIETPKGYYISESPSSDPYHHGTMLKNKLFDDIKPQDSFKDDWVFISNKPAKVSHFEKQSNTNYRFVLKDDSLASNKLPLEIKREDACNKATCGEYVWKDEWTMYSSLYELVSDPQPEIEVIDEFEFIILLSVDNINPPPNIQYSAIRKNTWTDERYTITNQSIHHQLLDKIIFPSLILHETSCKINSEEAYKLIRAYIKDNIDPKVAEISSDYDFCFSVVKKVGLAKPYTTEYEYKPKGKRKAELKKKYFNDRQVVCFEMTYGPCNYTGYTPIRSFEGKNETDLKEQIDAYLDDLIHAINEPLVECPQCNGCGVIKKS